LQTSSLLTPKVGYAIIVGISDYPGTNSDLSYCDDDALSVYSMLVNEYNFKPENIIYLQDSSATQSAISAAFDQIAAQVTTNDIFFFYYSGHGGASVDNQGEFYTSYATVHPLPNNYDGYTTIEHSNAAFIRLRFGVFNLEYGYDYVLLGGLALATDINAWYVGYTGKSNYWWSDWIPLGEENTLVIRCDTDSSVESWGYYLTRYEVETYDGTHYICPYDSIPSPSYYYLDTLLDSKLDLINCAEQYIVSDSCYSGGMIEEAQGSGRYMMMACSDEELSLEDSSRQHGCFTYNFLMSSEYATDFNTDGVISMEERFDYTYSNTVSRSTSIGLVHHPQEYDGISGQAILNTIFGSVSLTSTGNSLTYSFNLYGVGVVEELKVIVCNNSQSMVYNSFDLTTTPATNTGFGAYSGSLQLDGFSGLSGYGIYAKIEGNIIIYLNNTYSDDIDSDTLDDVFEIMLGLDPEINDTDSDGLLDGFEFYGDTDPLLNDTDNDGLSDGDEVLIFLTNPTNQDTDNDGLSDGDEVLIHTTDPLDQDTEGDGIDDYYEIMNELDPLVNDTALDYDSDGLNNLDEFLLGASANNNDTDSDGLLDGEEVHAHNTNPLLQDTDDDQLTDFEEIITYLTNATNSDTEGDGIEDGYEVHNDLDPFVDDAGLDFDSDGLINILEFQIGSYANDSDSDDDNMPDQYEYDNYLNLLVDDASLDYDSDGLVNLLECQLGCYANHPDSDSDGLPDGWEFDYGLNIMAHDSVLDEDGDGLSNLSEFIHHTDPTDADSDDDGLLDGIEISKYKTDPNKYDTDGDGDSDGIEVEWGTDPLNPKISLLTSYLNIAGGVVLACTGFYTVSTQIIKGKKKKDEKKSKGKFPIKRDQEAYNILGIKKTAKPKPKATYYGSRPSYTASRPRYTAPSRPSSPISQMDLQKIRNSILYEVPPAKPSYSAEGKKALLIAKMAFDSIDKGNIKLAFDFMIKALMLGVPEPTNSNIKTILLTSLDRGIGTSRPGRQKVPTSQKMCSGCGQLNKATVKYCINCGRLF